METENKKPIEESGINVDAVRAYMLSEDEDLPEVMERLRTEYDRVDLDSIGL